MDATLTLSKRYRRQSKYTRWLVAILVGTYRVQRHEAKQTPRNADKLAAIGVQVNRVQRLIAAVNNE